MKILISSMFAILCVSGCLESDPAGSDNPADEETQAAMDEDTAQVAKNLNENAGQADDATDPEPNLANEGAPSDAAGPTPLVGGPSFTTTNCGDDAWNSPATGTSHAGIRNCQISWGKDTSVSPTDFFQTVNFQLRDEETDGKCAQATVSGSSTFTECNGVWVSKSASLSGHHSSITVTLSWGGNDPVSRTRPAPSGF